MGGPTKKKQLTITSDFSPHRIVGYQLSDPSLVLQSVDQLANGEIQISVADIPSASLATSAILSWPLKDILGGNIIQPLCFSEWVLDTVTFPGVSSQIWVTAGIADARTYSAMTWALTSGLTYTTVAGTPRHKYGTRTAWTMSAELPLTQSRIYGKIATLPSTNAVNRTWLHQLLTSRIVTTTDLAAGLAALGVSADAAAGDLYFIIACGKEAADGFQTASIGIKVGKRTLGTPVTGIKVA